MGERGLPVVIVDGALGEQVHNFDVDYEALEQGVTELGISPRAMADAAIRFVWMPEVALAGRYLDSHLLDGSSLWQGLRKAVETPLGAKSEKFFSPDQRTFQHMITINVPQALALPGMEFLLDAPVAGAQLPDHEKIAYILAHELRHLAQPKVNLLLPGRDRPKASVGKKIKSIARFGLTNFKVITVLEAAIEVPFPLDTSTRRLAVLGAIAVGVRTVQKAGLFVIDTVYRGNEREADARKYTQECIAREDNPWRSVLKVAFKETVD